MLQEKENLAARVTLLENKIQLLEHKVIDYLLFHSSLIVGRLFGCGRKSGSAGSAFRFPYNSVPVGRILFKFGKCMQ